MHLRGRRQDETLSVSRSPLSTLATKLDAAYTPGTVCKQSDTTRPSPSARLKAVAAACALSVATGCATPGRTDNDAMSEIAAKASVTRGITPDTVRDAAAIPPEGESEAPPEVTLDAALRLASLYNRDLQTRRESLHRQVISLRGTRRDYGIALSGTIGYVLSSDDTEDTGTSSFDLSAGRPLPTGAEITLSAASSLTSTRSGATNASNSTTSGGVKIEQPLLAGAGYTASHQTLIQAERDTLYALRTFARDRQASAIDIVSTFYRLLTQKAAVDNARLNTQQSTLLRQRTEALFRVQRAPAIDVMRAQQQELAASNRQAQAESSFESARQVFLNTLGLSIDAPSMVSGTVPGINPVVLPEADALRVALRERLDLQTARDRVADAERKLRVARSHLLPSLDAYGQASWSAEGTRTGDTADGETTYSAGIALELPLDRRAERDAVRTAGLDLDLAQRNARQAEDQVRLDVAGAYRQIAYLAQAEQIEKRNLQIAEKRAENARMRFRNGELENRDVVEAENELLNARNALVQARVEYEIERLKLLRTVGILDVAADGKCVVRPIAEEERNP